MYVHIPEELRKEEQRIKRFVDAMIHKLRQNAHKSSFDEASLATCFERMHGEVEELQEAIAEGNAIEIMLEAADVANFALIASVAAIEGGDERQEKVEVVEVPVKKPANWWEEQQQKEVEELRRQAEVQARAEAQAEARAQGAEV